MKEDDVVNETEEEKEKPKPKAKKPKKPKPKGRSEVKERKIKVVGSLSELLQLKIDEIVPKIKKEAPVMLIGGVNPKDHAEVKGNTLKIMSRAQAEKKLEKDKAEQEINCATSPIIVSDRSATGVAAWGALESYCASKGYYLCPSEEKLLEIITLVYDIEE